ncbi:MAG: pyrroloquinoline quinone biosynthesis peptide chaperone PqqD [Ktedonobacteraceae bacterium]
MSLTFLQRLQSAKPRLASKARLQVDKLSGEPILLYPEGVVLLNATGEAIIQLCDGTRSFPEILNRLAVTYCTPADQLEGDLSEYILKLHQQSLVELLEDDPDTMSREFYDET